MQKGSSKCSLENDDLVNLFLCVASVVMAWVLLLGWFPGLLIGGHDATMGWIPYLQWLHQVNGHWTDLIYRADVLGGVAVHDAIGTSPLFELLARLGLSPIGSYNFAIILTQSLVAYLSVACVQALASLWTNGAAKRMSLLERFCLAAVFAFLPAFSWRYYYGHLNLVFGALVLLASATMVLSSFARSLSVVGSCICGVALVLGFNSAGQQLIVTGFLFSLPLGLVLTWEQREKRGLVFRALALSVAMAGCALFVSAPRLAGVVRHAFSGDTLRRVGSQQFVYSYTIATLRDWLSSIFWSYEIVPSDRAFEFLHETNYALGPVILFLALIPKARRPLVYAWGLGLTLVLILASGFTPLSTALIKMIPILGSFSVPARAVLPMLWLLNILGFAALIVQSSRIFLPLHWLWVVGGLLAFLCPAQVREVAVWLVVAAFLAVTFLPRARRWSKEFPLVGVLPFLAFSSIGAFRERAIPSWDSSRFSVLPEQTRSEIVRQEPRLDNPLNRAVFDFAIDAFQLNTAYMVGISSVQNYFMPARRFAELDAALLGEKLKPQKVAFGMAFDSKDGAVLRALYNVGYRISLGVGGALRVENVTGAAGAAWFASDVESVGSFDELAKTLRDSDSALVARLHQKIWTLSGEGPVNAYDSKCKHARVLGTQGQSSEQQFSVDVESPAACPLVVALNLVRSLKAEALGAEGQVQALAMFPAYGALVGMIVPAHTSKIIVRAEPYIPWWTSLLQILGVLGFMACLVAQRRRLR